MARGARAGGEPLVGAPVGEVVAALVARGCTCAPQGKRKVKVILGEGMATAELFRVASEQGTQIRRLQRQQSSLEDIFLQAVEG